MCTLAPDDAPKMEAKTNKKNEMLTRAKCLKFF